MVLRWPAEVFIQPSTSSIGPAALAGGIARMWRGAPVDGRAPAGDMRPGVALAPIHDEIGGVVARRRW